MDQNGNGKAATVRLDIKTKISLMASVIFSCGPEGMTERDAVESALKIQSIVDAHVSVLKRAAHAA